MKDKTVGKPFNEYSRPLQLAIPEDVTSEYYFSILTPDTSGKMLRIAESSILREFHLKQILQKNTKDDTACLVICYTCDEQKHSWSR